MLFLNSKNVLRSPLNVGFVHFNQLRNFSTPQQPSFLDTKPTSFYILLFNHQGQ